MGGAEGWRVNSSQRSVFMCECECKSKSRGNLWNTEKRGEGQRIWDVAGRELGRAGTLRAIVRSVGFN